MTREEYEAKVQSMPKELQKTFRETLFLTGNEIKPIVTFDERPILCPQCGYCHPSVIFQAREEPMSFDIFVECEKCGYRSETGEAIENLTEKWTNDV